MNVVVIINYLGNVYRLDNIKKSFLINNKKITYDEEKFFLLLSIIRLWNDNYISNDIISDYNVKIEIVFQEKVDEIIIKNKFPDNYKAFTSLMEDLYE